MAAGYAEAELRLKTLETLFTERHSGNGQDEAYSVETLLDSLLVLYNECCLSSFKREKTVAEFVDAGKLGWVGRLNRKRVHLGTFAACGVDVAVR